MQGSTKVINKLNELLISELTAMDLYLLQGRMCGDWGYANLQERLVHESADERGHADQLIERILFLGGTPSMMTRVDIAVGNTPTEMLQIDLDFEHKVAKGLNEAMQICINEGDNGSRKMLEQLLYDTEMDHIFWLESQIKIISDIGLQNYLAKQLQSASV